MVAYESGPVGKQAGEYGKGFRQAHVARENAQEKDTKSWERTEEVV
jgi:hypothetical protein